MVSLLVVVQLLDIFGFDIARPLYVELLIFAFEHSESSTLATIYNCVVNVGVVCYFEGHKHFLVVLT